MTGAEWLEMYQSAYSNAQAASAIHFTLVSGYMVVAYVVGAKLTRLQVTIANLLYICSVTSNLASIGFNVRDALLARFYAAELVAELPTVAAPETISVAIWSVMLVYVALVIGSLAFMWQIRHPGSD